MFWEDVWEEIKKPSMSLFNPLPTGIFLACTNVLVLPKLFKRWWCKYLQPVCKRRTSISTWDSCAALACEDVSGKKKAGSGFTWLLWAPKAYSAAIKLTKGISKALSQGYGGGGKLKYCEFYLVNFRLLISSSFGDWLLYRRIVWKHGHTGEWKVRKVFDFFFPFLPADSFL